MIGVFGALEECDASWGYGRGEQGHFEAVIQRCVYCYQPDIWWVIVLLLIPAAVGADFSNLSASVQCRRH